MTDRATVPRGRHAPPLEVRLSVQRRRLLEAAAAEFARSGYAEASAEAISRAAGMSKATFYEHFANKEECILALFDVAATEVLQALAAGTEAAGKDPLQLIGAGPRAAQRRDEVFARFAAAIDAENAVAARAGNVVRLASRDDAYAIVG